MVMFRRMNGSARRFTDGLDDANYVIVRLAVVCHVGFIDASKLMGQKRAAEDGGG